MNIKKENSINFNSKNLKKKYGGLIEIKPFYLKANFNYDGLSSRNFFNDDSIIIDLIKSEIFKNENLNANLKNLILRILLILLN